MEKGAYTVLMTPFHNSTGEIDLESFNRLINRQLNSNVTGVVCLGTTSESPTLDLNEKIMLVKQAWYRVENKKKKL